MRNTLKRRAVVLLFTILAFVFFASGALAEDAAPANRFIQTPPSVLL